MSRFDYNNFSDGNSVLEFVVNADKFTKEQAVELCVTENFYKFDSRYNKNLLRKPTVEDIIQRTVRYYANLPAECEAECRRGYTYCNEGAGGSFPVWVIEFDPLREGKG